MEMFRKVCGNTQQANMADFVEIILGKNINLNNYKLPEVIIKYESNYYSKIFKITLDIEGGRWGREWETHTQDKITIWNLQHYLTKHYGFGYIIGVLIKGEKNVEKK